MSHFFLFLGALLFMWGVSELQRRSIWDNVGMGCFNGCLASFGILIVIVTFVIVMAMRLDRWTHVATFCGSLFGLLLLLYLLDFLEELWRKHRGGDNDSS